MSPNELQPTTEEPTPITTISGRPVTSTVSFRLSLTDYSNLQKRAQDEGKAVATLVQEWVIEKLSEKTAAAAVARGA